MKIIESLEELSQSDQRLIYMCHVRPSLKIRALYSDATESYRIPDEPDEGDIVTIRLRTGRFNVDHAILVANGEEYEMSRADVDSNFDYYEANLIMPKEHVYYHFKVLAGKTVCYYNQIGASRELNDYYDFQIMPGFHTPSWARGAVVYQIFVDRFCNGDPSNDVEEGEYSYIGAHVHRITDWDRYPADGDIRDFYGGDLQGVINKLDYLQHLGVDVIYFNPLFVSPSNHKYDIQDYDYIDPHIGVITRSDGELLAPGDEENTHATRYIERVTDPENLEASNRLFCDLVREAHKRGIRVIIDGVFNHCGSFNRWLDKEHIYERSGKYNAPGAYISKESPYRNFFQFFSENWPNNREYDGWWGHDTLPKLNYEASGDLEDYILNVGRKWVSPPYNVDGWRLDVAADLGHSPEYNHRFWKKFREAVKQANPEAIILAENYGDSYNWLQGDEWDTIMNYDAFMEPVTWFLTGMQKHSDEFRPDLLGNADAFFDAMRYNMSRLGGQAFMISMNELSNHDHSRFLTRTNRTVGRLTYRSNEEAEQGVNKAVMMEAVVIQMTWPGAPTIYYGDEAGVCGWTDPDNRRTYPWGREDRKLLRFHRDMIRIHKENSAFALGSIKELKAEKDLIAYGRFFEDQMLVVVVNNSEEERRTVIPVWEIGLTDKDDLEQIMVTFDGGYSMEHLGYRVRNGNLIIGLRKTSAVVLRRIKW